MIKASFELHRSRRPYKVLYSKRDKKQFDTKRFVFIWRISRKIGGFMLLSIRLFDNPLINASQFHQLIKKHCLILDET